jgi:hypothetical protein
MNKILATALCTLLTLLCTAAPAFAVAGRPSAFSYVDTNFDRHLYAFVKGDNGHLLSNHFDGTSWAWMDHGVPAGSAVINNPKAVTYIDDSGNRRIYVFAVDNNGRLVVLYHKGAGFNWQWSVQGGPYIVASSLSATTFTDDNGVRRIYAFGFRTNQGGPAPYRLTTNFWNGNGWSWADLATTSAAPQTHSSFTEVTNYLGNDGRRRMDVFSEAGDGPSNSLLRHSWVESVWNLSNLGGMAVSFASTINHLDLSGNRQVHTFVRHPEYETIWDRHGGGWSEVGVPSGMLGLQQGHISATTYKDGAGNLRINLFAEWDKRLFLRTSVNYTWQPWVELGRPSSALTLGVKFTTAITYLDSRGGDQHTWVFMTSPNDNLYVDFWNGTSWQWFNLGNP